jgi:hypothetical protein
LVPVLLRASGLATGPARSERGYAFQIVEWFLVLLLVVLVTPVTLFFGAAFVATASMRRANRLVPGHGNVSPPLRWLWSPSSAALLHRRLRNACQLVASLSGAPAEAPRRSRRWRRRSHAPVDGIAELANEVLREAVMLDDQVVAASRLAHGLPRSQAMAALDYQVRAVEDAARRVHQLAARRAQLARFGGPSVLSLDQRITAMEEALNELAPPPASVPLTPPYSSR